MWYLLVIFNTKIIKSTKIIITIIFIDFHPHSSIFIHFQHHQFASFFINFHPFHIQLCSGVQSIAHLNAQIQLCWKKYLCSFSESEGLNNDQTTLWIQNFASKFFSGLIKANPPKNTLYHSVQMVLVDPCDKFISNARSAYSQAGVC